MKVLARIIFGFFIFIGLLAAMLPLTQIQPNFGSAIAAFLIPTGIGWTIRYMMVGGIL